MPESSLAMAASSGSCERPAADSDEDLMLRYRNDGEQPAATELVERYSLPLKRYLSRLAGPTAAEDLLQTTFLRVHQRRGSYESSRPVHSWIYSIATHIAIDWMRRASRRKALSLESAGRFREEDDTPHALVEFLKDHVTTSLENAEGEESREQVTHAIERLPEHLRAATTLVCLRGLRYSDAAKVLHIPVGTLKSRVHRARQCLRSELGGQRDETSPESMAVIE